MNQLGPAYSRRATEQNLLKLLLTVIVVFAAGIAVAEPGPGVSLDSSITTVAGNGTPGYNQQQDGGPATSANLNTPRNADFDAAGNMYIADNGNGRVRKVDTQGTITTYAGGGTGCPEQSNSVGDGCPATSATFSPSGLAVAPNGDVYIADLGNRVRKIDHETGIISTVAGTGISGHTSDGGPAASAQIGPPFAVALDSAGNLYIAQLNHRIRKVDGDGTITTIAGTGTAGFSGDGGPAVSATINLPSGMAFDSAGNLYFPDRGNNRIRRIDTNGIITTVAGSASSGFSGDGGLATSAFLNYPTWVAIDAADNIYIADFSNSRIRKINSEGIITTVVGTGGGYSGDGGPANLAGVTQPLGINFDAAGALYIGGQGEQRIRKVSFGSNPDFGRIPISNHSAPKNVALRIRHDLVLASIAVPEGYNDFTVGEITGCAVDSQTTNAIDTVCNVPVTFTPSTPGTRMAPLLVTDGDGRTYSFGMTGVGVGAVLTFVPGVLGTIATDLGSPQGMAMDGAGHVYISDTLHHQVWRMNADGSQATIIAGHVKLGGTYQGDGGPATAAGLSSPTGLAVDAAGNVYIADRDNHVVRKVDAAGTISTVVGDGTAGSNHCAEGGAAVDAQLNGPQDVAIDDSGNLYVADTGNHVVRRVSANGTFTTFAGDMVGGAGYGGDGGAATAAKLNSPTSLAVDADGNVFIADSMNYVLRKVDHATRVISTVAGTPESQGSEGDGEAATSAKLGIVNGVAVDSEGSLYVAESNHVIRKVDPEGVISTVAGNATLGAGSEEGLATQAQLNEPAAVDVDGFGNLYIADKSNGKLRKVTADESSVVFADTNVGETGASQTVTIRNAGMAILDLEEVGIDNQVFALVGSDCNQAGLIEPGHSCNFAVAFSPTAGGATTGTGTVTSNAANSPHVVALAGTGLSTAATTTTSLAASPMGEVNAGSTVILTAVVSASSGTPAGTVTFYDRETSIGSSTLTGGAAVLEISTLSEGQHVLRAKYAGNESFLMSTSNTVDLTIVAPPEEETADYTLTANPTSLTIVRGQLGQATITLTPLHGFKGTVDLSCGALPVGVTCTFTPAPLVSTGEGPVTSTLVVRTTAPQLSAQAGPGAGSLGLGFMGLAGMVVMATGRKRRWVACLFLMALLTMLVGCADMSSPPSSNVFPTPIGQHAVTVTATGTGAGSGVPQHSVQLTINVTN